MWYESGGVTVTAVRDGNGSYNVTVEAAQPRDMVLHWAVNDWEAPPPELLPPGSHKVCGQRVQQ